MTEDVRRRGPWLLAVPMAMTAVLLFAGCGTVSRLAVDRDPAPPTSVPLDVAAPTDAALPTSEVPETVQTGLTIERPTAVTEPDPVAVAGTCAGWAGDETLTVHATADEHGLTLEWGADASEPSEVAGAVPAAEVLAPGDAVAVESAGSDIAREPAALALQPQPSRSLEDEDFEPYDPWVSFNEQMFEFNRELDRVVLKPVATVYDRVVPDRLQLMISSGFDNLRSIPRMVNSILQGKFDGALREFGRLVINTTIGIGGLFDMAQQEWGIERSEEDFGQTLGVWGVGAGPYLVLPLMEPMTVRDGIGRALDAFMDPLAYLLPFFWERLTIRVGEGVNDRSLNLELYEGFEDTVIDMYSAVRHIYLQRRERMIRE